MSIRPSPVPSSTTHPAPSIWRWQGVAGGLRHRPVLAILLGAGCLLLILAVGCLVVLPEFSAQRHWRLATQASAQGDLMQARSHLEHCLDVWRRSGATHFEMARLCRRGGDFDSARNHLDLARQFGWPSGALDLEFLLMQVQEFGPRGTDEATLHHFIYSNKHPEERLILEALIKGYLHTFYLGSANRWLNYWIGMHPEDWQPYLWRGQLLERLKKDDEACSDYRQVLKLSPEQGEATLRLAGVLQRRGIDYEEASRLFRAFLTKHPDSPTALLGLANCQRGQRDNDGARKTLDHLLAAHPDMVQAHMLAAMLASDAEDFPRALEHLRKAEAAKPNEPDTLYQLAIVLRRLEKDAEADKYLAKHKQIQKELDDLAAATVAVMENPREIERRFEAGRILLRAGEEEGIRWLLTVLQEDADHRETHLLLAEYYEKTNDPDAQRRAKEHRRRAGPAPASSSSP